MIREDKAEFADLIGGLLETYHQAEPSARVMQNWWIALEDLSLDLVRRAVQMYMRTGKYVPKPSDIRGMVNDAIKTRWFSADEAWAHAQRALDESDTVVWTREASTAFNSAQPLLAMGDKVGARRAFEAAYDRAVSMAIEEHRHPVFLVSEGWDKGRRTEVISRAQAEGFLTSEQAARYLDHLPSGMTESALVIAGMVTGKVTPHPSANAQHFAEMMREALASVNEEQAQKMRQKHEARMAAKASFESKRQAATEALKSLFVRDGAK